MTRRALALALLLAPLALPAPVQAQGESARDTVAWAIRAYEELDFDLAARLLRRALASALDDSTRVQALTYLGAAEHYRGHADSAAAAFRRAVALAPAYQPDSLAFPPEITDRYRDVRTRALPVEQPTPIVHMPSPPLEPAVTDTPAIRPSFEITGAGAGMVVSVRARSAGGLPSASGTVFGLSARARFRRLELGVRYIEGALGGGTRDLVEGAATLRYVAAPWLAVHAGPLIRRYGTPLGAERWVSWRLGARTEAALFGPRLRGHAMLWQGLGLSVNVPPGSGTMRGGELGLTIDLPHGPFWFGLAYGIDQASVRDGGRRETVEMLTISAGVHRRP